MGGVGPFFKISTTRGAFGVKIPQGIFLLFLNKNIIPFSSYFRHFAWLTSLSTEEAQMLKKQEYFKNHSEARYFEAYNIKNIKHMK